jgi:energy-coupling factor transport system ATP-binding protein
MYPSGQRALDSVDLKIDSGDFLAIMGENGAGKTTLAKQLNGLLKPTLGRVTVDGDDHLLFSETVKEEVGFALKNFGYESSVITKQVGRTLEALDLARYADVSPFLLSGGERKRVALAAVLAWEPDYLILDEPTIGQDYQQKERLRNFILQLNSQGKAVVMVTHDVEFVAECNPKVVLMSKGRIVAQGQADEILSDDDLIEKVSLVKPQMAKLFSQLSEYGFPKHVVDVHRARTLLEEKLSEVKVRVAQSS